MGKFNKNINFDRLYARLTLNMYTVYYYTKKVLKGIFYTAMSILIIGVIVFFISVIYYTIHDTYCTHFAFCRCECRATARSEFSSHYWSYSDDEYPFSRSGLKNRGKMVYSLIDSIQFVGKSKSEVIDIIGFPDNGYIKYDKENSEFCYTMLIDKNFNCYQYSYDLCMFFDSTDYVQLILLDESTEKRKYYE